MDFNIKKIDVAKTTAKITLDRLNTNSDLDLKALAILLGGYNEFGRKINIEKHRENMIIFNDLIYEISKQIS